MTQDEELKRLRAEVSELKAKVWLLERDVSALGPENVRLSNAYNAALAEIARLTPRPKGVGRPPKDITGTYEEYLVRETMQELTVALQRGERMSESAASIRADSRIRATAANLQKAGMPGAFQGLASNYPADELSIYNAFRRGKRAMFGRKIKTKK